MEAPQSRLWKRSEIIYLGSKRMGDRVGCAVEGGEY